MEKDPDWQRYLKEYVEPRTKSRHIRAAVEAEEAGDWLGAASHLDRLVKEKSKTANLKERHETAKQKWAEQKAEWERKGREVNAAREQVGPKGE